MKAVVFSEYGSMEGIHLIEKDTPTPKAGEVLVKIHATSLNGSDIEMFKGEPYYGKLSSRFNPSGKVLGSDISGDVVGLGKKVTYFKEGDAVFGDILDTWGGLAEYVCVKEEKLMLKPPNLSYEEAAALPQSAVIALQAMRDHGQIEPGQKVLINGAGGSAGLYAIQIAKSFGAEVTAVDNPVKQEAMIQAGADHTMDYTKQDCTKSVTNFDFILDLVAYRSIFDYSRILNLHGKYALVGGRMRAIFQGLISGPIRSFFSKKSLGLFFHKPNTFDLFAVTELIATGNINPIIDEIFSLENSKSAIQKMCEGKALGKIVIKICG